MKVAFKLFLTATVCCLLCSPANSQRPQAPLTNASVVKLVRAGFKEKTVIAIINSRPSSFRVEPEQLIELKRNGVSENIILAMLSQDDSFFLHDDDWSLDSTLGRSRNRRADGNQNQPGTDIFGSSGGSKGQSSGRGLSGENDQETMTTGSATVRILRPPSEAGGAAPMKLEKIPTLDNEGVIKLVEAGFSEGTIIKRIEHSPADFDMSEAKVAELRRRRVPDTVITAMTAAMNEEPALRRGTLKTKGN